MGEWTGGGKERWKEGGTNGWMDGRMFGETEGWTDNQMNDGGCPAHLAEEYQEAGVRLRLRWGRGEHPE